MIYLEYKLKEKFGWTQEELENEPADVIDHSIHIMGLEAKRDERQKAAAK